MIFFNYHDSLQMYQLISHNSNAHFYDWTRFHGMNEPQLHLNLRPLKNTWLISSFVYLSKFPGMQLVNPIVVLCLDAFWKLPIIFLQGNSIYVPPTMCKWASRLSLLPLFVILARLIDTMWDLIVALIGIFLVRT